MRTGTSGKKEVVVGLFDKFQVPLEPVESILRDFGPKELNPWLDKLGVSQTVVV